jgi:serine/threonine protein kinase
MLATRCLESFSRVLAKKQIQSLLAAHVGDSRWPRCTLAYAPPDVVSAVDASRHIIITAAQDMWALGVMAFEAIVQKQTLTTISDINECAHGRKLYPWELPAAEQPRAWRQSRLRSLVLPCLARDAAQRPASGELLAQVRRLGQATTMR